MDTTIEPRKENEALRAALQEVFDQRWKSYRKAAPMRLPKPLRQRILAQEPAARAQRIRPLRPSTVHRLKLAAIVAAVLMMCSVAQPSVFMLKTNVKTHISEECVTVHFQEDKDAYYPKKVVNRVFLGGLPEGYTLSATESRENQRKFTTIWRKSPTDSIRLHQQTFQTLVTLEVSNVEERVLTFNDRPAYYYTGEDYAALVWAWEYIYTIEVRGEDARSVDLIELLEQVVEYEGIPALHG